ncbi:hypothetical protein [Streptomyces sp. NBC_01207]|uniref:hypothetical protein n=1 Tax=Streptomyces sp. NBC_01207 TaxID=2903772 RepID=UPI002E11CEAF|nr:hypothetical protein OG457_07040 [Streptomyces sp. NBC_01207]
MTLPQRRSVAYEAGTRAAARPHAAARSRGPSARRPGMLGAALVLAAACAAAACCIRFPHHLTPTA